MQMLKFGVQAKDKVTGFVGTVIGHSSFMTGCDQYLLSPPVDERGQWVESRWFDEARLNVLGSKKLTLEAAPTGNGCDESAPIK
jgi:hypothetical protein